MSFNTEDEEYVGEVELEELVDNQKKEGEVFLRNQYEERKYRRRNRIFYFLYLVDWIIVLVVLGFVELLTRIILPTYERYLPPNWEDSIDYSYPVLPQSYPSWCLVFLFVFPMASIFCSQLFYRSIIDLHHGLLGMLFTFTINQVITEILKNMGGEYRPNFKGLCNPDPDTGECRENNSITSTTPSKSFPSGHTSIAFCLCVYGSLYLGGKMRIFRPEGISSLKAILFVIPILAASVVGITRTMDYYHHFVDITAGAVIGIFCALFGYHVYYPHLWSEEEWKPKDRIKHYFLLKKNVSLYDIGLSMVN